MKKILYKSFSTIVVLLLLQACYKDEGNYNYTEINEVSISGINDSYEKLEREIISITPVLSSSIVGHENSYTYEWITIRKNPPLPLGSTPVTDTIARTRNLTNYEINLPVDNYEVHYRVTDQTTGVIFEEVFSLIVKSKISTGYLVMNDIDGWMRLDMLSYLFEDYVYISDVLNDVGCELPAQQGPIKTVIFSDQMYSPGNVALYLLTRSGTNRIHYETFHYDSLYNVKYQFTSPVYCPPGFTADNLDFASSALLHGQGNLYNYSRPMGYWWAGATNTLDGGLTFFSASSKYAGSGSGWAVFDEDTKSFYQTGSSSNMMQCYEMPVGTLTPYKNTGMDLMYITYYNNTSTSQRFFYAILKNTNNEYWLLRFDRTYSQELWQKIEATDIDQADYFAFGGEHAFYLYYNVGGKIYEYDTQTKQTFEMLDKGNDKITFLNFVSNSSNADYTKGIVVCSYNETTKAGMMEIYAIPNLNGTFSLLKAWNGFGKIVHVAYK